MNEWVESGSILKLCGVYHDLGQDTEHLSYIAVIYKTCKIGIVVFLMFISGGA